MKYTGCRGAVSAETLKIAAEETHSQFVLLDASLVFGRDHIESAIAHAETSFRNGTATARSLVIEVVRFASGERQISTAMSKMCSRSGNTEHVLLISGSCTISHALTRLGLTKDDNLIECGRKSFRRFGITAAELKTVDSSARNDLVIERVALAGLAR